ncbi:MAG: translation initiation factor IF-6 [Candidatus Micrarchaeia archaeon]
MALETTAFDGNPYVGIFCATSEKITLAPHSSHPKFLEALACLGTKIVKTTIMDSNLLGVFCAMNSNGAIVPYGISDSEIAVLKAEGLNVLVMKDAHNAIGNNICANDKGAIANPEFIDHDLGRIADCLGVEVVTDRVAGFDTVGSAVMATNKGYIAHHDALEDDLKDLESILGVKGGVGSLNMGCGFVRVCGLGTSSGAVAGEASSGFELARLSSALDII